ncbi:glyoxalase [Pedobacter ginsengisoli]|uniref:glyoxalase n=1 Tax=Pedobacter ginsengisoli TaxID=363852 RepID=UPI00254A2E7A|nr:glyoxalase [Pedobacter ginsengisoli]
MLNSSVRTGPGHRKFVTAVFLTFSGNCREALTFYQTCFGGSLQFKSFEKQLDGYGAIPVVSGSLVAESIIIHGSDLVHDEGRILGNYMAIFIHCRDTYTRKKLVGDLEFSKSDSLVRNYDDDQLIEITDAFDVRWILYV